jgi:hypothetical protein
LQLNQATVPPIETLETHIIGGAIIPLWQRFKTHQEARLRVVRVTTDDRQRIVGIQIPPAQVGSIVRSLGAIRDLREPDDIFCAILDEGHEVTLVAGLKLRRGFLHREPVIELCGADPYKFAELRELGLINEQIDWKQRFFIPTDEKSGVEILSRLLDRYPILVGEPPTEGESNITESAPAEMSPTQIVDLDRWVVPVTEPHSGNGHETLGEPLPVSLVEPPAKSDLALTLPPTVFVSELQPGCDASEKQLAFDF